MTPSRDKGPGAALGLAFIPLVDLVAQHAEIAGEVLAGFERVLSETAFIGGSDVANFEREFADFVDVDHCISVANGTDALELILRALGVGPGCEVILPANTFVATAEAVVLAGATPVLVDCDRNYLLIDPQKVADRITSRTSAVIGVDLYGQIAPFEQLASLLEDMDIALVEDAAESQGATREGRPIGALVRAAATSFYPGKNLGAYGDAGAVVTNDPHLAGTIRALANHGGHSKYEHRIVGRNSRLDTLQAVVLRAKLRQLRRWNDARRARAGRYLEELAGEPHLRLPETMPGNEHVWHLFVTETDDRDRVLDALNRARHRGGAPLPEANPPHRGLRVPRLRGG